MIVQIRSGRYVPERPTPQSRPAMRRIGKAMPCSAWLRTNRSMRGLGRLAGAGERGLGAKQHQPGRRVAARHLERRPERPGRHGVDADAAGRELLGQALGEVQHRRARHGVVHDGGRRIACLLGGGEHDRAARAQKRHRRLGEPERRVHVGLERRVELLRRDRLKRGVRCPTASGWRLPPLACAAGARSGARSEALSSAQSARRTAADWLRAGAAKQSKGLAEALGRPRDRRSAGRVAVSEEGNARPSVTPAGV